MLVSCRAQIARWGSRRLLGLQGSGFTGVNLLSLGDLLGSEGFGSAQPEGLFSIFGPLQSSFPSVNDHTHPHTLCVQGRVSLQPRVARPHFLLVPFPQFSCLPSSGGPGAYESLSVFFCPSLLYPFLSRRGRCSGLYFFMADGWFPKGARTRAVCLSASGSFHVTFCSPAPSMLPE